MAGLSPCPPGYLQAFLESQSIYLITKGREKFIHKELGNLLDHGWIADFSREFQKCKLSAGSNYSDDFLGGKLELRFYLLLEFLIPRQIISQVNLGLLVSGLASESDLDLLAEKFNWNCQSA